MMRFEPATPLCTRPPGRRASARWAGVAAVAFATFTSWAAWLGWDRTYDLDPNTGDQSGPYQPWQVIGCVLCLVLVTALATRWLGLWPVVITLSVVFTLAFAVNGATSPEADGLWVVGAVMVFFGAVFGSAIVGAASSALGRRRGQHRLARDPR